LRSAQSAEVTSRHSGNEDESKRSCKENYPSIDNIAIVLQVFEGDLSFVTFNELGTGVSGNRYRRDTSFPKLGISSIGVVATEPNWHAPAHMAEAIPEILAVLKGRAVMTYGHSQGGYGALKFSRALGARAAISFCPQIFIAPEVLGHFDTRFNRYFKSDLQNGPPILQPQLRANNYVFFDPFESLGVATVKELRQLASPSTSIRLIPVHFSYFIVQGVAIDVGPSR
jgi:hypothetical protein